MVKLNSQDQKSSNRIIFDYIPEKITFRARYSFWISIVLLLILSIALSILNIILPQNSIWNKIMTDLNTAVVVSIIIGLIFIKIPEFFSLSRNIRLVEFLLEIKDFKIAEEIIIECYKINPNKSVLYNLYGRLLIENNKLDLAEKVLLKELQKNKKYTRINYNLASLYILKDNINKAEKHNKHVLQDLKKDPRVLLQRVLILLKKGSYEEMILFFRENIEFFMKNEIILEEGICYMIFGAANLNNNNYYNEFLKKLNLEEFKRNTNSYQILISSYIMKDGLTLKKIIDYMDMYNVFDSFTYDQINIINDIKKENINNKEN